MDIITNYQMVHRSVGSLVAEIYFVELVVDNPATALKKDVGKPGGLEWWEVL